MKDDESHPFSHCQNHKWACCCNFLVMKYKNTKDEFENTLYSRRIVWFWKLPGRLWKFGFDIVTTDERWLIRLLLDETLNVCSSRRYWRYSWTHNLNVYSRLTHTKTPLKPIKTSKLDRSKNVVGLKYVQVLRYNRSKQGANARNAIRFDPSPKILKFYHFKVNG